MQDEVVDAAEVDGEIEPIPPIEELDNVATWLARRVPGYGALSVQEKRAVTNFCLIWSLFEGTCLNERGNIPEIERAVVRLEPQLGLRPDVLAQPLAYFRNRYWDANGQPTYRFDHLHFRQNDRRPHVEAILKGEMIDPCSVAIGLLIIVYRLRNNLFHGPKWQYELREQQQNFENATALLISIMDLRGDVGQP